MMMNKLMKCGHSANGFGVVEGVRTPCCVCCFPRPESMRLAPPPDLEGRKARCPDCGSEVPSDVGLAFFGYRPDRSTDSFYCGCRGWN